MLNSAVLIAFNLNWKNIHHWTAVLPAGEINQQTQIFQQARFVFGVCNGRHLVSTSEVLDDLACCKAVRSLAFQSERSS